MWVRGRRKRARTAWKTSGAWGMAGALLKIASCVWGNGGATSNEMFFSLGRRQSGAW